MANHANMIGIIYKDERCCGNRDVTAVTYKVADETILLLVHPRPLASCDAASNGAWFSYSEFVQLNAGTRGR